MELRNEVDSQDQRSIRWDEICEAAVLRGEFSSANSPYVVNSWDRMQYWSVPRAS